MFTPKRLDRALSQHRDATTHGSFLERANGGGASDEARRRAALGAYLVARLVDRLVVEDAGAAAADALRWQRENTVHYLRDLPAGDGEAPYLMRIASAVDPDSGSARALVRIALTEYASYLEFEGRLEEALDALRLSATTWGGEVQPGDFASLALFAGRLNRQLGRWDIATDCYAAAEDAAAGAGDRSSALRARLGRAGVLRALGRLEPARDLIEAVIEESDADSFLSPVLGLAYADLGAVLAQSGRPVDAMQATYEAYRHTPDRAQRIRILGELGAGLAELGAYAPARAAFELVATSASGHVARVGAYIGLMDVASAEGDRVGFERARLAARELGPRLPSALAVDVGFRTAAGLARFGQFARARAVWQETLGLAEDRGLTDWSLTISRVLERLDGCRGRGSSAPDSPSSTPEAAALAADLDHLVALARA